MKRKLATLALPLLLAALMLGVKWRAEHPTPTKEDLEVRALLKKPPPTKVSYRLWSSRYRSKMVSKQEFTKLMDNLYLSPQQRTVPTSTRSDEVVHFICYYQAPRNSKDAVSSVSIEMNITKLWGWMYVYRTQRESGYRLHPVTVKRWIELLKANPRLGPELRARMK